MPLKTPQEIAAKIANDPVEWNARIEALRNVGREVLDIVKRRDTAELWDAGANLDQACESCHRSYWYPQSLVSDYATARIRLTVPLEFGCVASGEASGAPEVQIGKTPADSRHIYQFTAGRPARYLSFIVSRFIPSGRTLVRVADAASTAPEDNGVASDAAALTLTLGVDANPRDTRQARPVLARAEDVVKYYASVVGDAPSNVSANCPKAEP